MLVRGLGPSWETAEGARLAEVRGCTLCGGQGRGVYAVSIIAWGVHGVRVRRAACATYIVHSPHDSVARRVCHIHTKPLLWYVHIEMCI